MTLCNCGKCIRCRENFDKRIVASKDYVDDKQFSSRVEDSNDKTMKYKFETTTTEQVLANDYNLVNVKTLDIKNNKLVFNGNDPNGNQRSFTDINKVILGVHQTIEQGGAQDEIIISATDSSGITGITIQDGYTTLTNQQQIQLKKDFLNIINKTQITQENNTVEFYNNANTGDKVITENGTTLLTKNSDGTWKDATAEEMNYTSEEVVEVMNIYIPLGVWLDYIIKNITVVNGENESLNTTAKTFVEAINEKISGIDIIDGDETLNNQQSIEFDQFAFKILNGKIYLNSNPNYWKILEDGSIVPDDFINDDLAGVLPTTNGIASIFIRWLYDNKQDSLVSGTNIKTVNGTSLLGSGNIVAESPTTFLTPTITSTLATFPTSSWNKATEDLKISLDCNLNADGTQQIRNIDGKISAGHSGDLTITGSPWNSGVRVGVGTTSQPALTTIRLLQNGTNYEITAQQRINGTSTGTSAIPFTNIKISKKVVQF